MDNRDEILRAWLKYYFEHSPKMNKSQVAAAAGIKPSKITYILTGRVGADGEKYLQPFPFELQKKILDATKTSEKEAIRIGKNELEPDKDRIQKYIDEAITKKIKYVPSEPQHDSTAGNIVPIDHQHAEIIKKFQNRDLALVINQELLDLESMDPDKLKSVLDFIKYQKNEAEKEAAKKRDASNYKE
ncbi:hypothetical protein [Desulfotignum balticum]|uniref:hypothetical protein n=1 Tax=Desulfotignum balticum TaxID=115781 RepID=UPI0004626D29|nr:hypothetical protein [Desulfotignum balticum]